MNKGEISLNLCIMNYVLVVFVEYGVWKIRKIFINK